MQTATHTLKSTAAVSKVDATSWSRELWKAAYSMARRMIRDRATHGTGAALTWYLDHGFRRFGYAALPIVRAAGWAVFNQVHVTKAATGTPARDISASNVSPRTICGSVIITSAPLSRSSVKLPEMPCNAGGAPVTIDMLFGLVKVGIAASASA